jgi:hypothetical protein
LSIDVLLENLGELTGVWAEENTRASAVLDEFHCAEISSLRARSNWTTKKLPS